MYIIKAILRETAPIGFMFGIFFAIIAYLSEAAISPFWLIMLPILTMVLCIAGGTVASAVVSLLSSRYSIRGTVAIAVAFAVAAIFNVVVVLTVASVYGALVIHPRVLIGVVPGLGLGAAYAAHRYYIDKLNERAQFFEALTDKNKQLQEASRRLAIIEERNRMGRELHDSVSQGLHGLVFGIHSLRNIIKEPNEHVQGILDHMEATAGSTLDELKVMIEELRPSLLAEQGLEASIRTICELFSQNHAVPVEYVFCVGKDIHPELEMTIYRVTQEALANIGRHASASHVHVKLTTHAAKVILTIGDDGRGFDTHSPHLGHGLTNMRQRIEESGGAFRLMSRPNHGTTLTAEFLLKAEH